MVFRFNREKKAFVDKERKLLFKEGGGRGRWDEEPVINKYIFRVEDTEFIREEIHKDNDIYQDWSEERDKHNKRKYTVRLGDDPWLEHINSRTDRVSGSAPWTYETEIMYREAMYAFHSKRFPDHIDKIRVIFGSMGHPHSEETFVPNHPVYEAED